MAALAETTGSEWRALFDRRWSATSRSGVWSKREWVAPEVPDDAIEGLAGSLPTLLNLGLSGQPFVACSCNTSGSLCRA